MSLNNVRFIELVGLPGSGKTTLLKHLKKNKKIIEKYDFFDSIYKKLVYLNLFKFKRLHIKKFINLYFNELDISDETIKFILKHFENYPTQFEEINMILNSVRGQNRSLYATKYFLATLDKLIYINRFYKGTKDIIVDEGILYKLISFNSIKILDLNYNELFKYYKLQHVIVLDNNLNTITKRNALRKSGFPSAYKNLEYKKIIEIFNQINDLQHDLLDKLYVNNGINIIKVDDFQTKNIDKIFCDLIR